MVLWNDHSRLNRYQCISYIDSGFFLFICSWIICVLQLLDAKVVLSTWYVESSKILVHTWIVIGFVMFEIVKSVSHFVNAYIMACKFFFYHLPMMKWFIFKVAFPWLENFLKDVQLGSSDLQISIDSCLPLKVEDFLWCRLVLKSKYIKLRKALPTYGPGHDIYARSDLT